MIVVCCLLVCLLFTFCYTVVFEFFLIVLVLLVSALFTNIDIKSALKACGYDGTASSCWFRRFCWFCRFCRFCFTSQSVSAVADVVVHHEFHFLSAKWAEQTDFLLQCYFKQQTFLISDVDVSAKNVAADCFGRFSLSKKKGFCDRLSLLFYIFAFHYLLLGNI